MAAGVLFMQWSSYAGGPDGPPFFSEDPLTFNTRQERLHRLTAGDRLWLVSRCPVPEPRPRPALPGGRAAARPHLRDGPADPVRGIHRPGIANPASARPEPAPHAKSCGLWTKCDRVFADYFLKNWSRRREPLAFLLYDSPPALRTGAPVFIHSDKNLRLVARFRAGQFVAGYKPTVEADERRTECERVWHTHRAGTIDPQTKEEFDLFWDAQHGVRGLFSWTRSRNCRRPLRSRSTAVPWSGATRWGSDTGI
jgi:hypothetical protein